MIRKGASAEGPVQSRGGVHGEVMGMKKKKLLLLHCLHWFCVNKKERKKERRRERWREAKGKRKEMGGGRGTYSPYNMYVCNSQTNKWLSFIL